MILLLMKIQKKEKISPIRRIKGYFEAFRVDLSQRALNSKEMEDPDINFPTYNSDVLQYSENLNLIFKTLLSSFT